MARGSLLDGFAYGVLNELLGFFRTDDGYASPSRYEVIITPPVGVQGIGSEINSSNKDVVRRTSLEVTSVAFPGMTLETQEDTNIYGPTRKIVTGQSFADITTTIRLSNDYKERNFIDSWQRLIANRNDFTVNYYNDYIGSLQIYQLDRQDRRRHGVELVECFPVNTSDISLDYATNNSLSFVTVSWAYRYWKNLTDEADLPRSLLERIGDVFVNTVERKLRSKIPSVLRRL
tara:strand:- start:884 stop:1579 length:696 start_codon:yes stop_codon:yes gene_type:complete